MQHILYTLAALPPFTAFTGLAASNPSGIDMDTLNLINQIVSLINPGQFILFAVIAFFYLIVFWALFQKAGEPGWKALIPIYNTFVLAKITFGGYLWGILGIIPATTSIYQLVLFYKLGRQFRQRTLICVLCALFPFLILPFLAFGSAEY